MKMTDDTFAKLVAEEVKNRVDQDTRNILLQEENWSRWEKSLIILIENLDNQLRQIEEDSQADRERYGSIEEGHILLTEALGAYERRKKKIERFRFHVEKRLTQVSKMIATGVTMEDDLGKTLILLKNAIKEHKKLMVEFDLEETAIDRALWDALDGYWNFDKINDEDI